jgi:hypothetical protein
MGARGEYGKSKRDGEAVLEGDRQIAKGKEKSNTNTGVRGMIVLLISMICFFDRLLENDWRTLRCSWTTLVMIRCDPIALDAALWETHIVVMSSEMSI